jgi:hypothetical protein
MLLDFYFFKYILKFHADKNTLCVQHGTVALYCCAYQTGDHFNGLQKQQFCSRVSNTISESEPSALNFPETKDAGSQYAGVITPHAHY